MDARQDTRNFLGIFVLDDSTKHWTFRRYLVHSKIFSNFSCMFLNPNNFFQFWIIIVLIYNLLDVRNLQKQVKKVFC